jgi:hypothetical protein
MYRIHWESTKTGTKGHGVPVTFEVATAWVREMNEKYPEMIQFFRDCKNGNPEANLR